MESLLRYRGREVNAAEVEFIGRLIAEHPHASRRRLSQLLCEAWGWRQPNGTLCDMVCRGLMLALERAGHIDLPAVRQVNGNPLAKRGAQRKRPGLPEIDTRLLVAELCRVQPLLIRQVRRSAEEPLCNGLIEGYHYLGYCQPVGEHLKYLVYALDRPIACLVFSSAPRHLGKRDRFIGWSQEARQRNIRYLAYNSRFLILPFVRVEHLASHLLGAVARRISRDWETLYGHPVYYLESFVDPERFRGTCYRAAGWHFLGLTTGRGKDSQSKRANRSLKEVLGYPLIPDFRQRLGEVGP